MKKKKLGKKDFKYLPGYRYYAFEDESLGIEIGIEPCFNGFDVAIYKLGDTGPFRDKECTNEKYGSSKFIMEEIKCATPQPRREETWDHALKIANKFYRSIKSYVKARGLKILEEDYGVESSVFQERKIRLEIHGISPKGRV